MKTYRRTERKKKMLKYAEIAAAVLIVVAVVSILILAYNPNSPPTPSKVPATDYFAFSDLGAEYEPINGTDEMIKIKFLYLTLTPVGGNATGLHLEVSGYTDPLDADLYYPIVTNGTSKPIEVTFQYVRVTTKTGTTFPLKIRVYCEESEGYVTLQIPEANVFPL
jgi:hypothetical protein